MEQQTESKFDTLPIKVLLFKIGRPIILLMTMQALYMVVDLVFIANLAENGELAMNALTLAFPIQLLVIAVSVGTGVGANVMMSKSLGQGDSEKAGRAVGNALFLGILIYAAFLLFGLFGAGPYIGSQTSNPVVLEMGKDYLTICCTASFGLVFFTITEKLLQATGRTAYATIARIAGLVVNVVLDPILICGLPGMPAMGVRGAAAATVIAQIVSAVLAWIFHLRFNTELKKNASYLKPDAGVIRGIYAVGSSVLIAQTLIAVTCYVMNRLLGRIDEAAVTTYGIYYKIQQIPVFAAFAMRDAIRPVLSYHYRKEDRGRMKDCIHYGMRDTLIITAVGLIAFEVLAGPLSSAFGLSGSTRELLVVAMRVIPLSLMFAGANIAYHGIFLALEANRQAHIIPVFRQILFVLPAAFGFSLIAGQDTAKLWIVWMAFLITEFVTVLIVTRFMKKVRWEKIDILDPAAFRKEQELKREQELPSIDMPSNWF